MNSLHVAVCAVCIFQQSKDTKSTGNKESGAVKVPVLNRFNITGAVKSTIISNKILQIPLVL